MSDRPAPSPPMTTVSALLEEVRRRMDPGADPAVAVRAALLAAMADLDIAPLPSPVRPIEIVSYNLPGTGAFVLDSQGKKVDL
jgi:hypothetical protein